MPRAPSPCGSAFWGQGDEPQTADQVFPRHVGRDSSCHGPGPVTPWGPGTRMAPGPPMAEFLPGGCGKPFLSLRGQEPDCVEARARSWPVCVRSTGSGSPKGPGRQANVGVDAAGGAEGGRSGPGLGSAGVLLTYVLGSPRRCLPKRTVAPTEWPWHAWPWRQSWQSRCAFLGSQQTQTGRT